MTNLILIGVIPLIIFGMYQLWLCNDEDDYEWEEEDVFEETLEEPKRMFFLNLPEIKEEQ